MRNKKLIIGIVFGVLIIGILIGGYFMFYYSSWKFNEDRSLRVLIVNSYRTDFPWVIGQNTGFKNFFDKEEIKTDIRTFDMKTVFNDSDEWAMLQSEEADFLIEEFKPDVIYATDDNAQKYVAQKYLDSDILIVFSGVNAELKDYGYDNAENVVGMLERLPFVGGVRFLNTLIPLNKIAVISDTAIPSKNIVEDIMGEVSDLPDIGVEVREFEYSEDYYDYILKFQDSLDALVIVNIRGFKDPGGSLISLDDFTRWSLENSSLPELVLSRSVYLNSFVRFELNSESEGFEAAKLAYRVLISGENPQEVGFHKSNMGIQGINLKRAEALGIEKEDIPSVILVNSEVIEEFGWEDEDDF